MKKLFPLFFGTLILLGCSSDNTQILEPSINPSLKVVATYTITEDLDDFLGVNDIITYNITVKNDGDVTLSEIALTPSLTDLSNNELMLTTDLNYLSADAGSTEGNLEIDETATYSATYAITQSDVDAGGVSMSIMAEGVNSDGIEVIDVSDNGDDTDGNSSNDPTETIIEFNPLIISEYHVLNSDGDPESKFYFDDSGQLFKIYFTDIRTTPHPIYIYYFDFDAEQKLTNIIINDSDDVLIESIDITYDSAGRLTSIGDRIFEFFEDDSDYYIDYSTFSEDIWTIGDIEYTERYFTKYDLNPPNPIASSCSYSYNSEYNNVTGEFTESGSCGDMFWNDYNGNVNNDCSDTDCTNFSHDSNTNPLYSTTNLIDIQAFGLVTLFSGNYSHYYRLISQNNVTDITYSDPSRVEFEYTFNDNNLPVSSTRQYFDVGDTYPVESYANYYYQGDEIPE